jgi:hypothetical protein
MNGEAPNMDRAGSGLSFSLIDEAVIAAQSRCCFQRALRRILVQFADRDAIYPSLASAISASIVSRSTDNMDRLNRFQMARYERHS